MADLELALRLTGDGGDLRGEVRLSKGELDKLTQTNDQVDKSGRRAGKGLDEGARGASVFRRQAQQANQTGMTFQNTMTMLARVGGLVAGALGGISLGMMLADMTQTIFQAEQLRGALLSAVGGVPELADRAFAALEQFASRTPFALDQSIQAFIKMQNLGIRPTEERMMGFGNAAAAMGKDLNQMIEAVADASTGEFERLKDFGIKASSEGDKVRFTFQGVTTEIAKDSDAIVEYLSNIGNQKFGDAMANQMSRLPGLWSNLKDNIDGIWRDLGDAGVTDMFSRWVSAGIQGTEQLRSVIKAGWFDWMGAELDVLQARWSGWVEVAKNVWASLVDLLNDEKAISNMSTQWQDLKGDVGEAIDAVADLPINLQTLAAIGIAEIDKLDASMTEFFGLLGNNADRAWESVSYASTAAWLKVKQTAAEAVESVIQRFGELVTRVAETLAAINSTGLGDQLVSDSALASIQQAGVAMQQYSGISQGVAADLAAANAEHARTETALNAERAGIEAMAAARTDAANQFIDDALAQREQVLANRAATVQEAEAAAAAAQANYMHNLSLKELGTSLDDVTKESENKTGATQAEVAALEKLLDRLDPTRAATRQYQADVTELSARLADGTITQTQYNTAMAALEGEAAKASDGLNKLLDRLDPTRAATRKYQADVVTLEAALAAGKITQSQYNTAVGALKDEAGMAGDVLGKLLDRLDPARAATRQYQADIATLNTALAEGRITQAEFNVAVGDLEMETARATGGVISMAEALETAAKRGIERVDDAAQGWLKNFFLTGKATFSGVKDLFLEMLAEIVYAAARNKIILTFASAGSGSLLSAGASAASVTGATVTSPASTITGTLNSLSSGITAAGARLYESIGNIATDLGMTGIADKAYAKMGATTGWTMGADLLGGAAGGYLGNKVFGPTSGLGATAGGIVGSFLLPPGIGAAVGSFLGSALESGLQKVFGQKNDGNNAGGASFDLSTGAIEEKTWGSSFDQANVDASMELAGALKTFADSIGGSSLAADITVGRKQGIQFNGQSFGRDTDAFLEAGYREVIRHATDLDDTLKTMLLGLEGDAESLARNVADAMAFKPMFDESGPFFDGVDDFTQTFQTLSQDFRRDGETITDTVLRLETGLALLDAAGQDAARSIDNFQRAAELIDEVGIETARNLVIAANAMGAGLSTQFRELQDLSARSNRDIYETQVAQIRELIAVYDGTAASSAALAQATLARRESELALLAEIEQVTASVTGRIASFREQLILDGLDEEGQYNRFRDQISDLAEQISTAGSAAALDRITSQIDALGKTAYGLLNDSQQDAARPELLGWLDTIEELTTDRLDELKDKVITTSDALDAETQAALWEKAGLASEKLDTAATGLIEASEAQKDAAQIIIDYFEGQTVDRSNQEAFIRQLRELLATTQAVLS